MSFEYKVVRATSPDGSFGSLEKKLNELSPDRWELDKVVSSGEAVVCFLKRSKKTTAGGLGVMRKS